MNAANPPAERPAALWPWGLAGLVVAGLGLVPLARAWAVAPDLGHGWAAPLLIFYLWWERWAERPPVGAPVKPRPSHGSMLVLLTLVLLACLPLRLLLTPYPVWPVALTLYLGALVVLTLGIVGRHFGRAGVIWVGGPLLILPGVMPWPGMIETTLILPLREGIAALVAEVSNLLGQPALASGTSIRMAEGWVGIDEACGGIRSMHAAVTTALFFGEWTRLHWGRRLGLIAVALVTAMLGNLARVGALSWAAAGPSGRLDAWHDPAGWAALGLTLGLTGWAGWRWGERHGKPSGSPPPPPRPVALASWWRISPAALLTITALVAFETGTRWWYAQGPQTDSSGLPGWEVQLPLNSASFEMQELSDAAHDMLRPDLFVSGSWREADGITRAVNYVEWHEGQAARHAPFFHNPEICLPSAGAVLVESYGTLEIPWQGGIIPFQTYHFKSLNRDMVVAFTVWDPTRGEPLRTPPQSAGWSGWIARQWQDVAEARQHQPAQLFTIALYGLENRERLADEVLRLMVPRDPAP